MIEELSKLPPEAVQDRYPLIAELKSLGNNRDREWVRLRIGVDERFERLTKPIVQTEIARLFSTRQSEISRILRKRGYDRTKITATRNEFARRAMESGDQDEIAAWYTALPERIKKYVRLAVGMDEEGHFIRNPMTLQEIAQTCGMKSTSGILGALKRAGVKYNALCTFGAVDYFDDELLESADDFTVTQEGATFKGTTFKNYLSYIHFNSYLFDDIRSDPRSHMGIDYLRNCGENIKHGMLIIETNDENELELRKEIQAVIGFGREPGRRAVRRWHSRYQVTIPRIVGLCISENRRAEIAEQEMFSLAQRCQIGGGLVDMVT